MRDLLLVSIFAVAALMALRRPWIGVMLWTWLSIMNPHRYTYGFAYSAPLAATAVGVTLLGLLFTKDRDLPFKGTPVTIFTVFMAWITLSWLLGLDPANDYEQWKKVMKIDFMILVALALLHTKNHIIVLAAVAAGSMAILGAKGGLFTLTTGGDFRVWGPPGSFIQDNNEFALALVMTIPLLRFLQQQLTQKRWAVHAMTGVMLLCAVAALGSYSRGGFIAISAMTLLLWWRGKRKVAGGVVLVAAAALLIAFMPEQWSGRMDSISSYESDRSVQGRFSAWWTAWGVAKDYLFGAGFDLARPDLFAIYSPTPDMVHAAHSIYFQSLGNHGFIGLALFVAIWISSWWYAAWLRKLPADNPQTKWCSDLGAMCQVSLIGYAVGGAFLSLTYFDLPYNVMVLIVLARQWVLNKGWEKEEVEQKIEVPSDTNSVIVETIPNTLARRRG